MGKEVTRWIASRFPACAPFLPDPPRGAAIAPRFCGFGRVSWHAWLAANPRPVFFPLTTMHNADSLKEPTTLSTQYNLLPESPVAQSAQARPVLEGAIVDGSRGQYRVETPDGVLICTLPGRLRKNCLSHQPQRHAGVAGRRRRPTTRWPWATACACCPPATATASSKRSARARAAPSPAKTWTGRVRVASPPVAGMDQVVVVFAARDPAPHLGLLDRSPGPAPRREGLATVICLNKIDLGLDPALAARLSLSPPGLPGGPDLAKPAPGWTSYAPCWPGTPRRSWVLRAWASRACSTRWSPGLASGSARQWRDAQGPPHHQQHAPGAAGRAGRRPLADTAGIRRRPWAARRPGGWTGASASSAPTWAPVPRRLHPPHRTRLRRRAASTSAPGSQALRRL